VLSRSQRGEYSTLPVPVFGFVSYCEATMDEAFIGHCVARDVAAYQVHELPRPEEY
jgi:hypothetical protein